MICTQVSEIRESILTTMVVNKLIKNSFGKEFVCNYHFKKTGFTMAGFPVGDYVQEPGRIGLIVKETRERRLLFFYEDYIELVGKFNSQDGSAIRVVPEYLPQAKYYEELYEKETGKKARIAIAEIDITGRVSFG